MKVKTALAATGATLTALSLATFGWQCSRPTPDSPNSNQSSTSPPTQPGPGPSGAQLPTDPSSQPTIPQTAEDPTDPQTQVPTPNQSQADAQDPEEIAHEDFVENVHCIWSAIQTGLTHEDSRIQQIVTEMRDRTRNTLILAKEYESSVDGLRDIIADFSSTVRESSDNGGITSYTSSPLNVLIPLNERVRHLIEEVDKQEKSDLAGANIDICPTTFLCYLKDFDSWNTFYMRNHWFLDKHLIPCMSKDDLKTFKAAVTKLSEMGPEEELSNKIVDDFINKLNKRIMKEIAGMAMNSNYEVSYEPPTFDGDSNLYRNMGLGPFSLKECIDEFCTLVDRASDPKSGLIS
ncbi:MAG: hypothetical protein GYA55_14435 [SAR324 cluster bacterium]|uniref:DUF3347 domain-containing protein n=1 Tax=SAR324 cluster bacterium TaxID=2024889 RepID=A0A7X9FU57_9DELT|nr:hypothetical protein [SAR324 cluster bacterium]